jgi:hypothetical protein
VLLANNCLVPTLSFMTAQIGRALVLAELAPTRTLRSKYMMTLPLSTVQGLLVQTVVPCCFRLLKRSSGRAPSNAF